MHVERVQKWIVSSLVATVMFIFAGGIGLLSKTSVQAGARPGLLIIAALIGVVGVAAVRLINQKSVLTPWLVTGLIPALLAWWLTR